MMEHASVHGTLYSLYRPSRRDVTHPNVKFGESAGRAMTTRNKTISLHVGQYDAEKFAAMLQDVPSAFKVVGLVGCPEMFP